MASPETYTKSDVDEIVRNRLAEQSERMMQSHVVDRLAERMKEANHWRQTVEPALAEITENMRRLWSGLVDLRDHGQVQQDRFTLSDWSPEEAAAVRPLAQWWLRRQRRRTLVGLAWGTGWLIPLGVFLYTQVLHR
jgi:hypothetical protein